MASKKIAEEPLQLSDMRKFMALSASYDDEPANEIFIRVDSGMSHLTTLVHFTITIHNVTPSLGPLLRCWIDWPYTSHLDVGEKVTDWVFAAPREVEQKPLLIQQSTSILPKEVSVDVEDETTCFYLTSPTTNSTKTVTIEFDCPNAFFSLREKPPFGRKRLAANLEILNGSERSVVYLEYPNSISLRPRKDNAEYHTLATAVGADYQRKVTFFPQRTLRMRYTFGENDAASLSAPGVPLLRAGLGLTAAGFALQMLTVGNRQIAATALAVALLPTAVFIFERRRPMFFPSSIALVEKRSYTEDSVFIAGVIYLAGICVTALVLGWHSLLADITSRWFGWQLPPQPNLFHLVSKAEIGLGVLIVILSCGFFITLSQGGFLAFACDHCERLIRVRKRAKTRPSDKRTLCKDCGKRFPDLTGVEGEIIEPRA